MTVYLVFAENEYEDQYIPVDVFDNEPAAQHRANGLFHSEIIPFEVKHEDTAPEIVVLTYDDGDIFIDVPCFDDNLHQCQNTAALQYLNIVVYSYFYCDFSILVDKKLLVDDWKERFVPYAENIVKQGKQMFVDGVDRYEIRKALINKIKADLHAFQEQKEE